MHRLIPVQQLLGRGGQGGEQSLGLGGGGVFHRLLPAQLLQLSGQGACGADGLLGLPLFRGQLRRQGVQLAHQRPQTLLPLGNLAPMESARPSCCSSSRWMRSRFSRLFWMLARSTATAFSSPLASASRCIIWKRTPSASTSLSRIWAACSSAAA